ncbi:TraB family protein, partial [bacterium]
MHRVIGNIHLVGTAHISTESVNEVKNIIEEIKPDYVAVELDKKRFQALTDKRDWKKIPIHRLLKSDRLYVTLANFLMSSFQKMIGQRVGTKPGEEMLAAVEEAKKIGAELVFIDADVTQTLSRAMASMSLREKLNLIWELFYTSSRPESEDEEIQHLLDNYNRQEVIEDMMDQLRNLSPGAYKVLLEERNAIMARNLLELPGDKTVVAVVGAAHVDGIASYLENPETIPKVKKIKKKSYSRLILYTIPASFIIAFLLAIFHGIHIKTEITRWVIINGSLAALGAALVGASLPAIVVAFLAAPITSLSPFLAAG